MKKTVKNSPHRQTIEESRNVIVELPAALLETLGDTLTFPRGITSGHVRA